MLARLPCPPFGVRRRNRRIYTYPPCRAHRSPLRSHSLSIAYGCCCLLIRALVSGAPLPWLVLAFVGSRQAPARGMAVVDMVAAVTGHAASASRCSRCASRIITQRRLSSSIAIDWMQAMWTMACCRCWAVRGRMHLPAHDHHPRPPMQEKPEHPYIPRVAAACPRLLASVPHGHRQADRWHLVIANTRITPVRDVTRRLLVQPAPRTRRQRCTGRPVQQTLARPNGAGSG